jgi:hypothetical protein
VQRLADGRTFIVDAPRNQEADRREVQRVYRVAFDRSDMIGRRRVLRRYTANFAHLAFDPDSWLWPRWQKWRVRYDKTDRAFLGALAKGFQMRGWGGMSKRRAQAWILGQAKKSLERLRMDVGLKRAYAVYAECVRSRNTDVQAEAANLLKPLLSMIERHTGYRTTAAQLNRLKLSGVLRLAVSKLFRVRERDLH